MRIAHEKAQELDRAGVTGLREEIDLTAKLRPVTMDDFWEARKKARTKFFVVVSRSFPPPRLVFPAPHLPLSCACVAHTYPSFWDCSHDQSRDLMLCPSDARLSCTARPVVVPFARSCSSPAVFCPSCVALARPAGPPSWLVLASNVPSAPAVLQLTASVSEKGRELARVWEWNEEYGEVKKKRQNLPAHHLSMYL